MKGTDAYYVRQRKTQERGRNSVVVAEMSHTRLGVAPVKIEQRKKEN